MWWTATFDAVWTASLLPKESTFWERAVDAGDADLVARDPVALIQASRSVDDCPPAWRPYLAAERSVDEFSGEWPEARQRAVITASFPYHQKKGTRRALDLALAPLGYRMSVVEWFEVTPRRRAETFRVRVAIDDDREWLASDRRQLVRVANSAKNAHTLLEAIEPVRRTPPATAFIGGVTGRRRTVRVGQIPKPIFLGQTGIPFLGALRRTARRIVIAPRP